MIVQGDVVRYAGSDEELVVVDVHIDPPWPDLAVCRDHADTGLQVKKLEHLTFVRHLDHIEGWREVSHGQWVKA